MFSASRTVYPLTPRQGWLKGCGQALSWLISGSLSRLAKEGHLLRVCELTLAVLAIVAC